MKITYITLFPELIRHYLEDAFLKKAASKGLMDYEILNLRDFSDNEYRSVDEKPYGGGDGLILRPDIANRCFKSLNKSLKTVSIYLSPQGKTLNHDLLKDLLNYDHIVLLNGRYGGVDQRVINEHIDLEISIGDFVLSGGELASLVLTESLARLIPGVVGDYRSVEEDSFFYGLLECSQFTRPQSFGEKQNDVPAVLLSGHHEKIKEWKYSISLFLTWTRRFDLFQKHIIQRNFNQQEIGSHYRLIINLKDEELEVMGFDQDDRLRYLDYLKKYYSLDGHI